MVYLCWYTIHLCDIIHTETLPNILLYMYMTCSKANKIIRKNIIILCTISLKLGTFVLYVIQKVRMEKTGLTAYRKWQGWYYIWLGALMSWSPMDIACCPPFLLHHLHRIIASSTCLNLVIFGFQISMILCLPPNLACQWAVIKRTGPCKITLWAFGYITLCFPPTLPHILSYNMHTSMT